MNYFVSTTNVHIEDSYKIGGFSFCKCLKEIRDNSIGETIVFERRSLFSLAMEWTVHNVLYKFHIKRAQTKDVDLNVPCDHPEWMYITLGLLSWIFLWWLIV